MGDKAGEQRCYYNIGIAYNSLGNFKKAIKYHERDLKMSKEIGDKIGEGISYCNLGNAYQQLGDFKKAIEYHERNLEIAKEVGDKAREGKSYGHLGNAYHCLGDFKKAIEYHKLDLEIAKEVGDKAGEGTSYGNLGCDYGNFGDFMKAIEYHEHDLKISKEIGDNVGERISYCNLGNAYLQLGDFNKAIEYHERNLEIAKEVGDKAREGKSYGNLGNAYHCLGDFKKAIKYHELDLEIAKEVGDKALEGKSNGNLGNAYHCLGDFKKAIEYHGRDLEISKEIGDNVGERISYCNLGNAYQQLGDFNKAIEYHERNLEIAKEVGDKAREGKSYGNLGNAYHCLGDFEKAIKYHERDLKISKEIGDNVGEGISYCNLGNAYQQLGDFNKAIKYHEHRLEIAKEVGDKAGNGASYGNLGIAYCGLGDFKKAIEHFECGLKIAKEVGDKRREGRSYCNLSNAYQQLGDFKKAIEYYERDLEIAKEVGLQLKDDYRLWRLRLKQGDVLGALHAVEEGRAQALGDLMYSKYGNGEAYNRSQTPVKSSYHSLSCVVSNTVFIAVDEEEIMFWVIQNNKDVELRRKEMSDCVSQEDVSTFITALYHNAREEIGLRAGVKCENRSLDEPCDEALRSERSPCNGSRAVHSQTNLRKFYDIIIAPIADLLHGNEVMFVPDGPFCLVPYAALVNSKSKYLSESFRIRLIPSLTTLKLVTDCPADFHNKTGALLVGDPCLEGVQYNGITFCPLPFARKEVETIGKILGTDPLIGEKATKGEVLKRLSSVALLHIAAHGRMETGEIALAPNPSRETPQPKEKDFILTMRDVLEANLRARLVVLSCCHSAQGEIKAEGVVGIAQAFLGAGARSVLVSLWAIDDVATLEFMKHFYGELFKGKKASEALNRAMQFMRESEKFAEVIYWAPFVLIGDDVTLELNRG